MTFDLGGRNKNVKYIEIIASYADRLPREIEIGQSISEDGGYTNVSTYTNSEIESRIVISLNEEINQRFVRLYFKRRNDDTRDTNDDGVVNESDKNIELPSDVNSLADYRRIRIYEVSFYTEAFGNINTNGITIKHKAAKWYDLAADMNHSMDDFDSSEETKFINAQENGQTVPIQNAHTLVDTLYVKKGTSIRLTLPDWLSNSVNNRTYQRWYNFMTGTTFATGQTGNNDVVDLLTPATISETYGMPANGRGYRFANGYVGSPVSGRPLYIMNFYYPEDGEDWYLVACDVSGYNDYTDTFERGESNRSTFLNQTNESLEPTLSHRFIYYIHAVDDVTDDAYAKLYPVVENITMPATRIPNHTLDMVALTRDARGYAVKDGNADYLTVEILNSGDNPNTAGIELTDESKQLSGEERVIHFTYPNPRNDGTPNPRNDGTRYVDTPADGSDPKATIVVKNGNTEVARFNLTFVEEFRLLSQSQVAKLDDLRTLGEPIDGNPSWDNLTYRTPYALNSNTDYELLTELNFDFSEDINGANGLNGYVQDECYPFPLRWTSSTYGFYDGSVRSGDFVVGSQQYPEWGYYGILNGYVECHDGDWGWSDRGIAKPDTLARANSSGEPNRYHLYADVSDRPGVIARLPFNDKLCDGTELFVTAWVKCARGGFDKENSGALFTIMGVKTGEVAGQKTTEYVPIYRYQTGQIPTTYANDEGVELPGFNQNSERSDFNSHVAGARNEWMQVYFSFINKNEEDFDLGYALQIDNNSAGTNGGDIYIDDIRIYRATVNPQVTQLEANCADEPVRVNVEFNWDRLLSATGKTEYSGQTNEDGGVMFCVLDKEKYLEAIANLEDKSQDAEAISYSAVEMGITSNIDVTTTNDAHTMELHYNLQYSANKDYTPGGDDALPVNVNDTWYFRVDAEAENDGDRSLMADFYSTVQANRTYIMLVANPETSPDALDWVERFEGVYADECGIRSEFRVVPQNMIRVNGEIIQPNTDFCEGQTYNFTAELRVPQTDEKGETVKDPETGQIQYEALAEDVYFDWFFGDNDEFTSVNATYNESLENALEQFRVVYPDAESVDETLTPAAGNFTQEMFNLIKYYSEEAEGNAGGQHAHPLVLHQQSINITLFEPGLELVAKPIHVTLEGEGDEGLDSLVCTKHIWLTLNVSHAAPQVKPGFAVVNYPENESGAYELDPCLRIGLKQIKSIKVGNDGNHSLTVDLRYAKFSGVDGGADNLKLAKDAEGNDLDGLYLVSTDDPEYDGYFADGNTFDQYALPVGTVSAFSAYSSNQGSSEQNKMTLQFNLDEQPLADGGKFTFKPKEGYTYNLAVHFEEYDGNEKTTACPGHFVMPIKVVPEYVKWDGDGSSNWNNDANWKRLESDEVKKTGYSADEYFADGTNTRKEGFVPMLFTKVLMPANSQAYLYKAGFSGGTEWVTEEDNRPAAITQDPTANIQYDLMAYGNEDQYGKTTTLGDIVTQRYRVNVCDQIHFEPGAEMLRAEYLLYNRAWTDVEVKTDTWSLVSTPLCDVYSGDWYTQNTGRQATEYFKPITFTGTTVAYDRLKPAVYQRSWSDGATIIETGDSKTPVSFSPLWSAAYNDVSVEYAYGAGYSIKPTKVDVADALFRFPKEDKEDKEDEKYPVSTGGIDRTDNGVLAASQLVVRNPDYAKHEEKTGFAVTLTPAVEESNGNATRFYIVGNPFTSNLDLEEFFRVNTNLEKKYWKIGPDGPVVGAADQEGNWISTGLGVLAPYQAMFVQGAAGDESGTVQFTSDMEKLTVMPDDGGADESAPAPAMMVKARGERGASTAALAFCSTADNDYADVEDAQLMTDIAGNGGGEPYVYTVAGDVAASVNRVKNTGQVPLGLFAGDGDVTQLTFTGVGALAEPTLYDTETDTETPLTEGFTLSVSGPSHGRYFIRAKGSGATGIADVTADGADGGVSVYSPEKGTVVVSSGAGITAVDVYSVGGALTASERGVDSTACTVCGVDSGVAIVRVTTQAGTVTRKITVK